MTLIAMAVYDTEESKRTDMTKRTIEGLYENGEIEPQKHRVFIIDNASCDETKKYLESIKGPSLNIITLSENVGTARAINQAWKLRNPGENCIKMDNDVIINYRGWIEELNYAISIDNKIGILGLKRKDCCENPAHENRDYRSTLEMINPLGTKWVIIEQVMHVIGTCQMYSSALLDKIGYLYQPGLYGYDDVIASHRSRIAGFKNAFLPHIDIDHIDPGTTPYQGWKERLASEVTQQVIKEVREYYSGKRPVYQDIY